MPGGLRSGLSFHFGRESRDSGKPEDLGGLLGAFGGLLLCEGVFALPAAFAVGDAAALALPAVFFDGDGDPLVGEVLAVPAAATRGGDPDSGTGVAEDAAPELLPIIFLRSATSSASVVAPGSSPFSPPPKMPNITAAWARGGKRERPVARLRGQPQPLSRLQATSKNWPKSQKPTQVDGEVDTVCVRMFE